jgi:hypothetical protein
MKTILAPQKNEWAFSHNFGIIATGNIKPTLVITERQIWNCQGWGSNYYKLGVEFTTEQEGKDFAMALNKEYDLPNIQEVEKQVFFNSAQSQDFLLMVQDRFPLAKIKK